MYVNFGVAPSTSSTVLLSQAIAITIDVIGMNPSATAERSFTVSSSYGTVSRSAYNASTRTTTITWTLPAGTTLPTDSLASHVPDLPFSFGDGLAGTQRITDRIVVTGVSGVSGNPDAGTITYPRTAPVDSSVVMDANTGALSPDGIY